VLSRTRVRSNDNRAASAKRKPQTHECPRKGVALSDFLDITSKQLKVYSTLSFDLARTVYFLLLCLFLFNREIYVRSTDVNSPYLEEL
jgi:hypothetical protein